MLDGERVRGLVQQRGWSLEQLRIQARRYYPKLSWATVSRVVNGKQQASAKVLWSFAQALHTTTDYLLGLTDDPAIGESSCYPVPTPDIAAFVARLNDLPQHTRERVVRIAEDIISLWEEREGIVTPEELTKFFRAYDVATLEQRAVMIAEMEVELGIPIEDPASG